MAIKLSTTIGNFTVEVQGETQLEAFDRMAEMAELISCGWCSVRQVRCC